MRERERDREREREENGRNRDEMYVCVVWGLDKLEQYLCVVGETIYFAGFTTFYKYYSAYGMNAAFSIGVLNVSKSTSRHNIKKNMFFKGQSSVTYFRNYEMYQFFCICSSESLLYVSSSVIR